MVQRVTMVLPVRMVQSGRLVKMETGGLLRKVENGKTLACHQEEKRVQLVLLVLLVQLVLLVGMASTMSQMHLLVHSGWLTARPRQIPVSLM